MTTEEKALKLNLQPTIYGVFAEIGAGQEVINTFYRVGAASGTIAKGICAYDMSMSDSIYGHTKRYVSKTRLESMLNVEYTGLISALPVKASTCHFFAFANTVETIDFNKTRQGQGWIGIRFQTSPNIRPIECKIHVILKEESAKKQQLTVGKIGVNLIYACYELRSNKKKFVESLLDEVALSSAEINFIEFKGDGYNEVDNLEYSLLLVKLNYTKMIMYGKDKATMQPLNAFYKKDVVLVRGRFNPPTLVNIEMIESARRHIVQNSKSGSCPIACAEVTFNCFKENKELDIDDLVHRVNMLSALDIPVLVTNFEYHHELISFCNENINSNSLNIVLGIDNFRKSLPEIITEQAEENVFKLIQAVVQKQNCILVFPELKKGQLVTLNQFKLGAELKHLIGYLTVTGRLKSLDMVKEDILIIKSDEVRRSIEVSDKNWQQKVPAQIVNYLENINL